MNFCDVDKNEQYDIIDFFDSFSVPDNYGFNVVLDNICKHLNLTLKNNLELPPDRLENLDRFIEYVNFGCQPEWMGQIFSGIANNKKAHKTYRTPFQQLMFLDMIQMLINRHGLNSMTAFIFRWCGDILGTSHCSHVRYRQLSEILNKRGSVYVIPRRSGKTAFLAHIAAIATLFFPAANLRTMYVVHNKKNASEFLRTVITFIKVTTKDFNRYSKDQYDYRKRHKLYEHDFYYHAYAFSEGDNEIRVGFQIKKDDLNDVWKSRPLDKLNTFTARCYNITNCLRGLHKNFIIVDEANFLKRDIYTEVVPMLATDNGKIVCASSQKTTTVTKKNLPIDLLPGETFLMARVAFVCFYHYKQQKLTSDELGACPCNLFSIPGHLNVGGDFKQIADAFFKNQYDKSVNTRDAGECGGLPPGVNAQDLLSSENNVLADSLSIELLLRERYDVTDYILNQKIRSKPFDVVVYLDPAPMDTVNASRHAMVFVARFPRSGGCYDYVILAAEDFRTCDISKTDRDCDRALSTVFFKTINALYEIYRQSIHRILLIIESNAMQTNRFWIVANDMQTNQPLPVKVFAITRTDSKTGEDKLGYHLGLQKTKLFYNFFLRFLIKMKCGNQECGLHIILFRLREPKMVV
jgi:hypothetical protein